MFHFCTSLKLQKKTSENLQFSDVFKNYVSEKLVEN